MDVVVSERDEEIIFYGFKNDGRITADRTQTFSPENTRRFVYLHYKAIASIIPCE